MPLEALASYRHPAAQKGLRRQQSLSHVEDQLSLTVLGFALAVVDPGRKSSTAITP